MLFRLAKIEDLRWIMPMFEDAVARMLREGKQQWDETYPCMPHILDDIMEGWGYVMADGDEVVGYGAVVFSGEPAYDGIVGEWLSNGEYVVIHRIVVAQKSQGRGVATLFFEAVERLAAEKGMGSFRIDTNFDNFPMLHLMDKCGFTYCGEVSYVRGKRKAFEKLI